MESDSDYEPSQDNVSFFDWRFRTRNGRHFSRRPVQRVVDSDSECEYDGEGWSVSFGVSIGNQGLEKNETKSSEDVKPTEETSAGPSSVDSSNLGADVSIRSPNEDQEPINLNFLERFLKMCRANEEKQGERARKIRMMKLLPSSKWKASAVANFAEIRTQFESYTRPGSEAEEVVASQPGEPQNDSSARSKFCFGQTFTQLASTHLSKPGEAKLTEFFLDLQDQNATTSTQVGTEKLVPHILGHPPTMNSILQLSQTELNSLVRWNLIWLRDFGFINKCQGEWLYAALAFITVPIEPTILSDLRSIASILITIRYSVTDWKLGIRRGQEKTDAICSLIESAEDKDWTILDFIHTLNLFIYIIGDYFQQRDLLLEA